jgi:hypothetical protein
LDGRESDQADSSKEENKWPGLNPQTVATGERVSGVNKRQLRRENKNRRIEKQETQPETSYWSTHKGQFTIPTPKQAPKKWVGEMCPRNLALHHPAAAKLLQYATGGCPANTGKPWSREEMQAAIDRGPHISAMDPDAMKQLATEVEEKVKKGQARLVLWDDIKENPPPVGGALVKWPKNFFAPIPTKFGDIIGIALLVNTLNCQTKKLTFRSSFYGLTGEKC